MAKGLRASSKKTNKANLRARVFGPVVEARSARLAAKAQKIVESEHRQDDGMAVDKKNGKVDHSENPTSNVPPKEMMDMDKETPKSSQFKPRKRAHKSKKSSVFAVGRKHGRATNSKASSRSKRR